MSKKKDDPQGTLEIDGENAKSFGEAMERLEEILQRIEGEEIDIDQLGEELSEATGLLEVCREKIRRAETEVEQILEKLDE